MIGRLFACVLLLLLVPQALPAADVLTDSLVALDGETLVAGSGLQKARKSTAPFDRSLAPLDVGPGPFVDTERLLLPLLIGATIPGSFGSIWTTELVTRNTASVPIWIGPEPSQMSPLPAPDFTREPETTFQIGISPTVFSPAWLYVETGHADDVAVNLRVKDISRQSLTYGTEMPVVREREFRTSMDLMNIPTDDRFRSTLRIYRQPGPQHELVQVMFYDMDDNRMLAEAAVGVEGPGASIQPPPYGEIGDLTAQLPQLRSANKLRIKLIPDSPEEKIWAFVSVTNNETQHVTLITPQ
ncbi:MAG: hypothetical protein ABI718_11540 [Acidobacteriota bacterium]